MASFLVLFGKARGKQKDKEHALTIEKMTNRDGQKPSLLPLRCGLNIVSMSVFVTQNRSKMEMW